MTRTAVTDHRTFFEDYTPGQRWRHARGSTIGEVENQLLSKLVMNTAQEHWNDDSMKDSAWGASRIVFGLVTASVMIGLASQDASDSVLAEVGLDDLRLTAPVFHGDVLYAFTVVLGTDGAEREDAGLVRFQHYATKADGQLVARCIRTVLVKRRSHWVRD
ncbi:MAG: hypothetical protein JWM64_970 [Frankiales bacterium]|nr:hypothetical protein [Frankiales bacterium]